MKLKERTIMIWITMVMFGVSIAVISVWGYLQDVGAQSSVFVNVALGNVALFGLSVLALVHSLEVATDKASARIFMVMVVLVYLGVICDNLSWALDGSVRYSIENCMLNAGAYLINPIILVMFWYYQNRVFFDDSQHSKKIKLIVSFIAIVDIVYILIGTATGWLFYIGSDGVYYYGDGFFVIYACPIIIILCCIYENLRREFPLQKRVSLLAFGVVPMFALLFSILSPDYSITYIAFYFNLTLVYGTVQVKKEQEIAKKNAIIAERGRIGTARNTDYGFANSASFFVQYTYCYLYLV